MLPVLGKHVAKLHEVAKYFTEIGGMWSGNILAMDAGQYNALSGQEKGVVARSRRCLWRKSKPVR